MTFLSSNRQNYWFSHFLIHSTKKMKIRYIIAKGKEIFDTRTWLKIFLDFVFLLSLCPYTYNTLNNRKYCISFPTYNKLTIITVLYTRRSSSFLLSQLIALNFSTNFTRWNMSQNAHVHDTHSYNKDQERKLYYLSLTATFHDSANTKLHNFKRNEMLYWRIQVQTHHNCSYRVQDSPS